jgi:hypothetical protein
MSEENPGRLADELRLLLDAAAERAQPWLQKIATATDDETHNPQTCGWCPLCNGVALLRGDRSELAAKAAEHLAGLVAVLRAALAEPAAPVAEEKPPASAEEPRVQHIQVVRRRTTGEGSC